MKFGVREICDVVLKAKATQKVGNRVFYKNEPVIYFDTLKTSTMEGAATTVYAQGGAGNARLIAWEGERTVTFTMEDALMSPTGFMILSGAGLIEASEKETIKVHRTEQTDKVIVASTGTYGQDDYVVTGVEVILAENPYVGKAGAKHEDLIYVMRLNNGEVDSEPYIPDHSVIEAVVYNDETEEYDVAGEDVTIPDGYRISLIADDENTVPARAEGFDELNKFRTGDIVLVDYYVEKKAGAQQIDITPDKFGGNYYLEASTLFRTTDGVDLPAEFIIPNCKIQSNFTFTMASSGDPSTFTFTMDAFPDYTRFNKTKKVLAAIQIEDAGNNETIVTRTRTTHDPEHEKYLM